MEPEVWSEFARDCEFLRGMLVERDTPNLRALHWYDMPLHEVVSPAGMARVAEWNRGVREEDEIAGNYDLISLYYAPAPGDGLQRSGATVWRCEALDSQPWFDADTSVGRILEANAERLIAEYQGVAASIQTHPDNVSLVDRGRWTGLFFYGAGGKRNEDLCARCPDTAALLEGLPLCRSFGFAMYSGMEPNTHVTPHCGSSNLRLRHHLGLAVPEPEAGRLRVGEEWRHWALGKSLAFDDSFEHEVVHAGERTRVVLVVDVWHPGLTQEEVEVLSHPVFQRFGRCQRKAMAPKPTGA